MGWGDWGVGGVVEGEGGGRVGPPPNPPYFHTEPLSLLSVPLFYTSFAPPLNKTGTSPWGPPSATPPPSSTAPPVAVGGTGTAGLGQWRGGVFLSASPPGPAGLPPPQRGAPSWGVGGGGSHYAASALSVPGVHLQVGEGENKVR